MKELRRLVPYIRRYWIAMVLGVVVVTLAGLPQAYIAKLAGDGLQHAHERFVEGTVADGRGQLWWFAGAILVCAAVSGGLQVLGRLWLIGRSRLIEADLRMDLFRHLLKQPKAFFDRHATGDLMSRAVNDIEGIRMAIGFSVMQIFQTVGRLGATVAIMLAVDPLLTAVALGPLFFYAIVVKAFGGAVQRRSTDVQEQIGRLSTMSQENFAGIRVVKSFAREASEERRWAAETEEYLRRNLRLTTARSAIAVASLVFVEGSVVGTLWVGASAVWGGRLEIGDLAFFVMAQHGLLWPMTAVGWVINLIQRAAACMGRLSEIFDTPPAVEDRPGAADLPAVRGDVEVRGLTFAYPGAASPALHDVSFRVAAGKTLGVVGKTGAGKSTLAQLLVRLYEAPPGTILLDGLDVQSIRLESLRGAIAVVPQEAFLFSRTIQENITLGDPEAEDDDVLRVAQWSRIAPDVEGFPGRYEQLVGERGVTLSGGQKQRTSLARALLLDAPILVLDDCLSAVDTGTEREILDALRDFRKGRTSVVISHRLSVVREADEIVVLDGGRIVERGTHETLVGQGGLYADLWTRQQLEAELERA